MSLIRQPLSTLDAGLLPTLLNSTPIIMKKIQQHKYTIEEAKALNDFFIRAYKNRDLSIDKSQIRLVINAIISEIRATKQLNLEAALAPAATYFSLDSSLEVCNLTVIGMVNMPDGNCFYHYAALIGQTANPDETLSVRNIGVYVTVYGLLPEELSEFDTRMRQLIDPANKQNLTIEEDLSHKADNFEQFYILNNGNLTREQLMFAVGAIEHLGCVQKASQVFSDLMLARKENQAPSVLLHSFYHQTIERNNQPEQQVNEKASHECRLKK